MTRDLPFLITTASIIDKGHFVGSANRVTSLALNHKKDLVMSLSLQEGEGILSPNDLVSDYDFKVIEVEGHQFGYHYKFIRELCLYSMYLEREKEKSPER